ncbi:MAG: hypothetical protein GC166_04440 [Alphaproteobacteria bacterium]|nr:hypothetical protein [Alphaproteobacteria bacterium]
MAKIASWPPELNNFTPDGLPRNYVAVGGSGAGLNRTAARNREKCKARHRILPNHAVFIAGNGHIREMRKLSCCHQRLFVSVRTIAGRNPNTVLLQLNFSAIILPHNFETSRLCGTKTQCGSNVSDFAPNDASLSRKAACPSCDRNLSHPVAYCPYCGATQNTRLARPTITAETADSFARECDNVVQLRPPKRDMTAEQPQIKDDAALSARQEAQSGVAAKVQFLEPASAPDGDTIWDSGNRQPPPVLLLGMAAVLTVAFAVYFLARGPASAPPVSPDSVYAVRDQTAVRDAPTASGSQVVAELDRNSTLTGTWEILTAGERWFHISGGPYDGNYVWSGNLSTEPRPSIIQQIQQPFYATRTIEIRSAPDPNAPVLQIIATGFELHPSAIVTGEWIEIPLRHGGVGYIPQSAATPSKNFLAATAARPSFDCSKSPRWDEIRICANSQLAAEDLRMAHLYRAKRNALSKVAATRLRDEQREWLAERLLCRNQFDWEGCLHTLYEKRISWLSH